MIFCKQCGAPNDPSASFCPGCGTGQPAAAAVPVSVAAPSQSAAAAAHAPAPALASAKKKNNKALKIIGITGAVLVALFVALVVLGAVIDARKNGGKGLSAPSASSESKPAAAPVPMMSDKDQMREGFQMCDVVHEQFREFLKKKDVGLMCAPGGVAGGMALIIAYPQPILSSKEEIVTNNGLLAAVTFAGYAISLHPNAPVQKVYVMDSAKTLFSVTSEYAKQAHARLGNKQVSVEELTEEIRKTAKKEKFPAKIP